MKNKNNKNFCLAVNEKIMNGDWSLEQIQYLHDNRLEYNIDKSDIKAFLFFAYQFAYDEAMDDGVLTDSEKLGLNKIKSYGMLIDGTSNRYELQSIKEKIAYLQTRSKSVKRVEFKVEEVKQLKKDAVQFKPMTPFSRKPWSNPSPFDL